MLRVNITILKGGDDSGHPQQRLTDG